MDIDGPLYESLTRMYWISFLSSVHEGLRLSTAVGTGIRVATAISQEFQFERPGGWRGRFTRRPHSHPVLIATFSLPHDAVALEQAFQELPGLEVEAERIAAHSRAWVMPCVWAANADFDTVDAALADDPSVNDIVDAYEFDDEKYYQLDWTDEVDERVDTYVDQRGSILDAEADADGWQLRIRFVSRDQFDAFRDALTEQGTEFKLRSLTEPGSPRQSYGKLTPDQRDTLMIALEQGYYEVPRRTTVRKVADELDVSHQAVSERLRRGTSNLFQATLSTAGESVE